MGGVNGSFIAEIGKDVAWIGIGIKTVEARDAEVPLLSAAERARGP